MKRNPAVFVSNLADPVRFAREQLGFQPEPHQVPVLDSPARRGILCCNRQWLARRSLAKAGGSQL
jgi:hypothetical protein